eukprot:XP_001706505.1 Hypothetical protein GL50803_37584 [Giardia lamblia ATCC 50803]
MHLILIHAVALVSVHLLSNCHPFRQLWLQLKDIA